MRKILFTISVVICAFSYAQNFKHPFQNPGLAIEKRIENLLGLLTVEEKIGMMMDNSKAVPRLYYDEKADDLIPKAEDYTIFDGGTSDESGLRSIQIKVN